MSVEILTTGVLDDDFVVTWETMNITSGINNAAQGTIYIYTDVRYRVHC